MGYSQKDFEAAQAKMMEVAVQMCREAVAEAMEPVMSQLSDSKKKCAELERKEAKMKGLLESKLRESKCSKSDTRVVEPELHEHQKATLDELGARMDALCDMIDDIDHKVKS